jgi:HK97 family phage portal protein
MSFLDNFKRKKEPTFTVQRKNRFTGFSNWDGQLAAKEGYGANPWVYRCVEIRADAVASIDFAVRDKKTKENIEAHPLVTLINSPSPSADKTTFIKTLVMGLDLNGNAYAYRLRAGKGNNTLELQLITEPWTVTPQQGEYKAIDGYKIGGEYVDAANMLHIKHINPLGIAGQATMQAAGRAVDVDSAAATSQKISMQERGIADLIVSIDGISTADEYAAADARIKEKFGGNKREPWVIGGKTSIANVGSSPVEMDYINTRVETRDEICATFGVPVELVTGMGASNRASADAIRTTFYQDTVIPLVRSIVAQLNTQLASEYGDVEIYADYSNVAALQSDMGAKIDNAMKLWERGVPLNVLDKIYNLGIGETEGGDIGYMRSGYIPVVDAGGEAQELDLAKAIKLTYGD